MSYNGTNVLVKLGDTTILGQTSSSFDLAVDMIETTHKQSTARAKTYEAGEHGFTCAVESKLDMAEGADIMALENAAALGTEHDFESSSTIVGSVKRSGKCLISGVSISEPQNDVVTVSFTLQGTGVITRSLVTA